MVCREAFAFANGFGESSLNSVLSSFNQDHKKRNPPLEMEETQAEKKLRGAGRNVGVASDLLRMWLAKYIIHTAHNPPNKKGMELSSIQPHVLYPEYVKWCDLAKNIPLREATFRAAFGSTIKAMNVRIKASKIGTAQCQTCAMLKSLRASMVSLHWLAAKL